MTSIAEQLENLPSLHRVTIPDLWQQQAVGALREGKDVVVHAPTGAGKTLIFELWSRQGRNRGQAIYTVPTRALANDKLAEWRAQGWNVGIATGDLSENLSAPVIVATLETQKNRLIQGEGPALLVVDEYQMLGDADRGLNYELALALAPPETQLLLLSGSVANPQTVAQWLQRLGRKAVLIRHEERPVPLEEVHVNNLNFHLPGEITGYWPRLAAKALADDLGPILIFSPRRQAAESMAAELARTLPVPNPLSLSAEQKALVGEPLAKMLKSRIAYHHSGLSYAARAGVVEPLAKAGQLRIVVATMGLAAGINFSLRSVALAAGSYRRDNQEQLLRSDEILQMFGRAGRRGLDETGFILITANQLRLLDARPGHLSRGGLVDWNALLGLMSAAAEHGTDPFRQAVRVQERLFTTKPIALGIEESLQHPNPPCGLNTDAERARHVRRRVRQMLNSRGRWENYPAPVEKPLREIFVMESPDTLKLHSVLTDATALEKLGVGNLCLLREDENGKTFGRSVTVADLLHENRVLLNKWVRRLTNWNGRQMPRLVWDQQLLPLITKKLAEQKTLVGPLRSRRTTHPCPLGSRRVDLSRAGGFAWGRFVEAV
ncbi:MAG TPA: DEAD/DEAH box helicase [Candidatus Saccharimonadales bacterium]|nr:DEAD/DEAH box helicase [Candidatus Saccharimonadales bacterium]